MFWFSQGAFLLVSVLLGAYGTNKEKKTNKKELF